MEARLNYFALATGRATMQHLVAAAKASSTSTIPESTLELARIRASQINGCAPCVDIHTKDAAHAGETQLRLNLVATWREANVFDEAERAALELAEQGTRLADGGRVTDDAWHDAAKHYDEDELAALVYAIATINAFNRANVMVGQSGGDYTPGQFD